MGDKYIFHDGKRSWWDGSVTTGCGKKIKSEDVRERSWFDSGTRCEGCKQGREHKH